MKKIIENGKDKGYSSRNVQRGIDSYLDILREQHCLTDENYLMLVGVAERLEEIMSDEMTAEEAFVEVFAELEDDLEITRKGSIKNHRNTDNYDDEPILGNCNTTTNDRCNVEVTKDCGSNRRSSKC